MTSNANDASYSASKDKEVNLNVKNASPRTKSAVSITLMILIRSFVFILGTAPFAVYYVLSFSFERKALIALINVSIILLVCMESIDIFIYIGFNNLYRTVCIEFLKKIFSRKNKKYSF